MSPNASEVSNAGGGTLGTRWAAAVLTDIAQSASAAMERLMSFMLKIGGDSRERTESRLRALTT